MALALMIFLVILLLLQCLLLILVKNISLDVMMLQSDMSQVRRTFVAPSAPDVGGRPVPSSAEIAAARARAPATSMGAYAPNQVDASGMAQIGGAKPK